MFNGHLHVLPGNHRVRVPDGVHPAANGRRIRQLHHVDHVCVIQKKKGFIEQRSSKGGRKACWRVHTCAGKMNYARFIKQVDSMIRPFSSHTYTEIPCIDCKHDIHPYIHPYIHTYIHTYIQTYTTSDTHPYCKNMSDKGLTETLDVVDLEGVVVGCRRKVCPVGAH